MPAPTAEAVPSRYGLAGRRPPWAQWNAAGSRRYTIGVEEEVMLLDRSTHSLIDWGDFVLSQLSNELAAQMSVETHTGVVELITRVHGDVAGAVAERGTLRERLAAELRPLGVLAACAGTHPRALPEKTRISRGERYRLIDESMKFLARREPTMALHVHIGVPEPEEAVRLLNGLREHVPLLVALAANSPFAQGRDSGFASARTLIFDGFPRTGTPRPFACYADYVEAIDPLVASGALADASFLWWDVRLQPALGTVEVRAMDAQTTLDEAVPLIALIQSLARLELEREPKVRPVDPDVLAENRFLAARDGLEARLVDSATRTLVPVRALLETTLDQCHGHAVALGCADELEMIPRIAAINGAMRQRMWACDYADLGGIVSRIAEEFAAAPLHPSYVTQRSGRSD